MSNILRESNEILYNVRDVLSAIKERGGLASSKFLTAKHQELQGQFATVVLNVATLLVLGKKAFEDDTRWNVSEKEMDILVERARRENGDFLHEIAELRAAKGK
jgi:hypothetical protein